MPYADEISVNKVKMFLILFQAPSNTKLRVPLQIKVPYQMVMSLGNGEQSAFTVDPQSSTSHHVDT